MKIFGWLADHSGCGWYRIVLPLGYLREAGHDTRWGLKMGQADMDEADVIVGQRVFKPGPTVRWQALAAQRSRDYLLVYELDDDLFSVDSRNAAGQVFGQPVVRNNIIRNMQVADLVTVSTEPLAEVVAKYNRNVAVLPNAIPNDMLSWRTGRHNDRFTVGWQGGPTHDRDWESVVEPFSRWFRTTRRQGLLVELHSIGATPGHTPSCPQDCKRSHFPEVAPHRHTEWNPKIDQYYRSIDWRVALAPLAATRFNRSKSHLRALEAAMLGLPVIASNVEAYGQFVQHGVTGFLVDKPSDWGRWLGELAADPALCDVMGNNARAYVEAHTIERLGALWEKAYTP